MLTARKLDARSIYRPRVILVNFELVKWTFADHCIHRHKNRYPWSYWAYSHKPINSMINEICLMNGLFDWRPVALFPGPRLPFIWRLQFSHFNCGKFSCLKESRSTKYLMFLHFFFTFLLESKLQLKLEAIKDSFLSTFLNTKVEKKNN